MAVTTSTASRQADSVSALRSVTASVATREWVMERLVLRADSAGRLVPVARDIVRRTENVTESETTGDTSAFIAKEETMTKKEDTVTEQIGNEGKAGFVLAAWIGTILLAVLGTITLLARWKSLRN